MTRWSWIEDLILPLAIATFTSAWVSLWVVWAARSAFPTAPLPATSPVLFGLLLVTGLAVTRWTLDSPATLAAARWLILAAGLLAVLGATWYTYHLRSWATFVRALLDWGNTISPVFVSVVAGAFMWWLGIQLGSSNLPQDTLERAFYGGLVGLSLAIANNQVAPFLSPGEIVPAALVFLAAGLAALALISVENARRYQLSVTGTWLDLNRYWLSTVAGVIGLILLVGLVAAGFLSPAAFERLGVAFDFVLNALTFVVIIVIGAVVYVLAWLIFPVFERLLRERPATPPPPPPEVPEFAEVTETVSRLLSQYPWLNTLRQVLLVLLILAVLGLIFWWAVRRFNRLGTRDTDEVRESIATRELVWGQLQGLFRRRKQAAADGAPFLDLNGGGDDPRLVIRRAYQAMLEWAAGLSLPRRADQTPANYAQVLARAVPQAADAIDSLTAAYERARYAAEPPSLAEARTAEVAVGVLKSQAINGSPRSHRDR